MRKIGYALLLGFLYPLLSWAKTPQVHFDPVSLIIFWVTTIYSLSIIGQFFAKKIGQPSVLGELLMGIIVGNICYYFRVPEMILLREGSGIFNILPELLANKSLFSSLTHDVGNTPKFEIIHQALLGPHGADLLNTAYVLDVFSRFGIIYLLFLVGLETSWIELKKVGKPAILVASIGVLAPMFLGFIVFTLFVQHGFQTNIFIAATLSATSVGITARVLQDLKKIRTKEAKIILGAAMIDDVLGLFILALVSSLVLQGYVSAWGLMQIFISTCFFFIIALSLGPSLVKLLVHVTIFLELWEAKLVIAFLFIMLLSWLASLLNLSTIIGAFIAGVILKDESFENHAHGKTRASTIQELISPLQFLLAPLFFFLMGVQVKLESFLSSEVLFISTLLCIIAIFGKLLGGLAAGGKVNRLFIGIGMVPRGEVGLIFASMGRSIGVVNDQMFSAIVVMVVVTTVIAPPWMKWCLKGPNSNLIKESGECI